MKTSIIIPSRNERFLPQTIADIYAKATGDIEVVVVLDGYWPDPPLLERPNLVVLHNDLPQGMRPAINAAAQVATGQYLMKADAHCLFEEGFDVTLQADCDQDWVVVPRRKRLDAEHWCLQDTGKPDIDYMYVGYPDNPGEFGGKGLNGHNWDEKNRDPKLKAVLIDDLMSSQGSAWFMPRAYFQQLELMDAGQYGTFWNEFQEIGFKCWLSGGQVKVNKKTFYAHLHKGKQYGRGYFLNKTELVKGAQHTLKWLRLGEAWSKQTKPIGWLIEKFWPVPGWPADWEETLCVS